MSSDECERLRRVSNSHRRRFLKEFGAIGIAGVFAGCLGSDEDSNETETPNETETSNETETANGDPAPASFAVSELDPSEVTVSRTESADVSVTINNAGEQEETQSVSFTVDGKEVGAQDLTLDGGDSEDLVFEIVPVEFEAGDYGFEVATENDSLGGDLTVEAFSDLEALFSFDDGRSTIQPGEQTITGTFDNSYPLEAQSGEVTLSGPDGWEITAEEGTSFETLAGGDSQDVEWTVTIPEAEGEAELTVEESHEVTGNSDIFEHTLTVTVVQPLSTPLAFNFGPGEDDDVPEEAMAQEVVIDGLTFMPDLPDSVQIIGDQAATRHTEGFDDIGDTEHDNLYVTEHHGIENSDLGYEFPVENGVYEVTFHFGETWKNNTEPDDARVMNIYVNDDLVLEEWNTTAQAGFATAVQATVSVQVTDGMLSILGEPVNGWVAFNGLEIHKSDRPTAGSNAPYGLDGDWTRSFAEDFDTGDLDTDVWSVGHHNGRNIPHDDGWEYTRNEDVRVDEETATLVLQIDYDEAVHAGDEPPIEQAGEEEDEPYGWYSGAVTTDDPDGSGAKFSHQHGFWEAAIKFPPITDGVYPAFWMMSPDGVWPPEIDVAELTPTEPGVTSHNVHYATDADNPFATHEHAPQEVSHDGTILNEWHVYGVHWIEDEEVRYYVDGERVATIDAGSGTDERYLDYGSEFVINLTTHILEGWAGDPYQHDDWPYAWEVAWVRVWDENA